MDVPLRRSQFPWEKFLVFKRLSGNSFLFSVDIFTPEKEGELRGKKEEKREKEDVRGKGGYYERQKIFTNLKLEP